jgi:hypothetical protein
MYCYGPRCAHNDAHLPIPLPFRGVRGMEVVT